MIKKIISVRVPTTATPMETLLKRFQSFHPPTLKGTESAVECESWLDDIEMLFESLTYTDERRVKLIGYQLQEVAKSRWLTTKRALEHRGIDITWKVFKDEFYQRFFPVSYRKDKGAEFANLRQGQWNIEEYVAKFSALLRFAPHVAGNDEAVADQFINGLNQDVFCKARELSVVIDVRFEDVRIHDIKMRIFERKAEARPHPRSGVDRTRGA